MRKPDQLLIINESKGRSKTWAWKGKKPFQVPSHPHLMISRSKKREGIELREAGEEPVFYSFREIEEGLDIPSGHYGKGRGKGSLQIRLPNSVSSPFETLHLEPISGGRDFYSTRLYLSSGYLNATVDFNDVGQYHLEKDHSGKIFEIKATRTQITVKSFKNHLDINVLGRKKHTLKSGQKEEISRDHFLGLTLTLGEKTWSLGFCEKPEPVLIDRFIEKSDSSEFFKTSLGIWAAFYAAVSIWTWWLPSQPLTPATVPEVNPVSSAVVGIIEKMPEVVQKPEEIQKKEQAVHLPSRFFKDIDTPRSQALAQGAPQITSEVISPPIQKPVAQVAQPEVSRQTSKPQPPKLVQKWEHPQTKKQQPSPPTVKGGSHLYGSGNRATGTLEVANQKSAKILKKNSKELQDALGGVIALMREGRGNSEIVTKPAPSPEVRPSLLKPRISPHAPIQVAKNTELTANFQESEKPEAPKTRKPAEYAKAEVHSEENTALHKTAFVIENTESRAVVEGGLRKEEIASVIRSKLPDVRQCYESISRAHTVADGKVTVAFTIEREGRTNVVKIEESLISDNRLEQCLVQRVRSWIFPKPRNGVPVEVSYPFVFRNIAGGG